MARLLAAARHRPARLTPTARVRQRLHRKRLTILANLGRHTTVLAVTTTTTPAAGSVPLMLRAAALWMTSSLDEAAETAARACAWR